MHKQTNRLFQRSTSHNWTSAFLTLLATFLILLPVSSVSANTTDKNAICTSEEEKLSEEEWNLLIELYSLDWHYEGTQKLTISHSSIAIPDGYMMVLDDNAKSFSDLSGNSRDPKLEGIVVSEDFKHLVYYFSHNDGYVSLSDWNKLDAKKLLSAIVKNTEKDNVKRKKNGHQLLHVVGWLQEPTLDRTTNTVFWAIELTEEGRDSSTINSIAIRLGRRGFERVVWVGDKEDYTPFGGVLDVMLRAHSFDPGYQYTDFSKGDKVAAYGITSLIAATIGGKMVKSGGIFLGLKKVWGAVAVAISALFYRLKNFFFTKQDKSNPSR